MTEFSYPRWAYCERVYQDLTDAINDAVPIGFPEIVDSLHAARGAVVDEALQMWPTAPTDHPETWDGDLRQAIANLKMVRFHGR